MKFLKSFVLFLISIFVLFLFLELISMKIFPEYSSGQVYKKIDDKNRIIKGKFEITDVYLNLKRRNVNVDHLNFDNSKNTIWFFGDSVTRGYGVKYTDTYFFHLKNFIEASGYRFNIFSSSGYGSNLINVIELIKKNKNIFRKNDLIVFQFNYNDVIPEKKISQGTTLVKTRPGLFRRLIGRFDNFRFAYLHKSTFFRVMTHYASIFKLKGTDDCNERGVGALGQYTYSYGSERFLDESYKAWDSIEKKIIQLKNFSDEKTLKLIVLISPISLQFDSYDKLNFHRLDLNCSKIDGRKKIIEILKKNNVIYSDPFYLFQKTIDIDTAENNFEYLFFEYDTNHPNEKGHLLLGISLFEKVSEIFQK